MPLVFGDIAQLGERLNGIQEVVGSIPIISTKFTSLAVARLFYLLLSKLLFISTDTQGSLAG